MKRLLECVPNFSEGKNSNTIKAIRDEISNTKNVKLLHIDSGFEANRTVYTFIGEPENVIEAAFKAAKKASELINMETHKGVHPRFGACDVCPFIPVKNIGMDETVKIAHNFGKRLAEELNIHVYFYENAALKPERKNLEFCRKGEYELLQKKLTNHLLKPDLGPDSFNSKTGATAVGAREFLIAYHVNLETKSVEIAKKIAEQIRESGSNGKPGKFKNLKAIGWYLKDHDTTQVSMNLTDFNITPMHLVFEEIKNHALKYNTKVTGSEIVGMIPMKCIDLAAQYYNYSKKDKIDKIIKKLGLNDLYKFDPNEKIIELKL